MVVMVMTVRRDRKENREMMVLMAGMEILALMEIQAVTVLLDLKGKRCAYR